MILICADTGTTVPGVSHLDVGAPGRILFYPRCTNCHIQKKNVSLFSGLAFLNADTKYFFTSYISVGHFPETVNFVI